MLGSCCQKDKTHRRSSKDRAKCFYVGFRHNVNRVQREGSIEMMKILIRPLITFSRTHTHTVLHIRTKQSGWHFMKNKMPTESCVCVQDRRDEGTGKWNCIKHIHTYIHTNYCSGQYCCCCFLVLHTYYFISQINLRLLIIL